MATLDADDLTAINNLLIARTRPIKVAGTTGNWATAGTWVGGVAPAAGDSIVIKSGVDVTVAAGLDLGQFGPWTILGTLNIASGQSVAVVPADCTIADNDGTITDNYGSVLTNGGIVTNNYGIVTTNNPGTVGTNLGNIKANHATVTTNAPQGKIHRNSSSGTVVTNNGEIELNSGSVTNAGTGVILYGTGGVNSDILADTASLFDGSRPDVKLGQLSCVCAKADEGALHLVNTDDDGDGLRAMGYIAGILAYGNDPVSHSGYGIKCYGADSGLVVSALFSGYGVTVQGVTGLIEPATTAAIAAAVAAQPRGTVTDSIGKGIADILDDTGTSGVVVKAASTVGAFPAASLANVVTATVGTEGDLEAILAVLAGVATVDNTNPAAPVVTFKKRDGTTTKITITYSATDGTRTASAVS